MTLPPTLITRSLGWLVSNSAKRGIKFYYQFINATIVRKLTQTEIIHQVPDLRNLMLLLLERQDVQSYQLILHPHCTFAKAEYLLLSVDGAADLRERQFHCHRHHVVSAGLKRVR
ncbi:hypothetical protein A2Z33_03340 [Candidatus Gottesmanbacteria bacterium RBG_16_52_11]|uniref:Uncharacterized protein n=1 Tax=Candidatus Gottesmanbacteria bacterium RBG_16_52_11 TaxID=1798374 RepID=A0A1F5YVL6_9BACT|nr:MAG: hypothetical protein A2Z33_03340 [Candidatus Gottesmanbacteria bacterium RBG_16_52_11]